MLSLESYHLKHKGLYIFTNENINVIRNYPVVLLLVQLEGGVSRLLKQPVDDFVASKTT